MKNLKNSFYWRSLSVGTEIFSLTATIFVMEVILRVFSFDQAKVEVHYIIRDIMPILVLGFLLDAVVALNFGMLFCFLHILFKKQKKIAYVLSLFVTVVVGAFILIDLGFYKYSGNHLDERLWGYFSIRDLYYLKHSIKEVVIESKFVFLVWVFFGLLLLSILTFRNTLKKQGRLESSRNTLKESGTLFILISIFTLFLNYKAIVLKSKISPDLIELTNNVLLKNYNQLLMASIDRVKTPSDQVFAKVWEMQSAGKDVFYPFKEYPWIKQANSKQAQPKPKKNLIFIQLESFGALDVSPLSPVYHHTTPEFEALTHEGYLFRRAYMNGIPTAPALGASQCSLFDPLISVLRSNPDQSYLCGANVLANEGYQTAFLAGQDLDYDNMARFFGENGFHQLIGQDQFSFPAEPQSHPSQWGSYDDRDTFHEAIHWIDTHSANPFFLTIKTTTNHDPFPNYGGEYQSIEGVGKSRRMHSTMKFVDASLGEFIREFKKRSIYKDSIVFIFGDHPSWFGEDRDYPNFTFNPVLGSWIPFLILNPVGLEPGQESSIIASQVDFIPTAMDMLGISHINPWMGHSLLDTQISASKRFAFVRAGQLDSYVLISDRFACSWKRGTNQSILVDKEADPYFQTNFAIQYPKITEDLSFKIKALDELSQWSIKTNHVWNKSLVGFLK